MLIMLRQKVLRSFWMERIMLLWDSIGRQTDLAPEFGTAMREKRVFSTVQCIIGSPDNVKGLFTIDRCKESAQWAEYEIEMAVVTASLINILAETECDDN